MADLLKNWFTTWWDWIDSRQIIRRVIVLGTWGITLALIWDAWQWAKLTPRTGAEIAAILAAFMTPLTILQGFVTNFYFKAREGGA